METNANNEVMRIKDTILTRQTKRIKLLEEKIIDMRKRYFQLKYADVLAVFKENLLARENY